MPNWCSNTLTVSGSAEAMTAFYACLDKNESGDFRMNSFLPMPAELENTTSPNTFRAVDGGEKKPVFKDGAIQMLITNSDGLTEDEFNARNIELRGKYGFDNWYDWHCQNWGTKWDVAEPSEQFRGDDEYRVAYETAWSPNLDFLRNIVDDFPELTFTLDYFEGGMGFAGQFNIKAEDGEIDEEKEIGHIKLKIVANEEDDDDAPAVYHFISDNDDDDEYDEWLDTLDGNYEEALTDYGIDIEQIDNYDELVASFQ